MATTRMTNDIRENIRDAMLKHRFADEYRAMIRKWRDFALTIYCDVFSAKHRAMMDGLPSGWLESANTITINFDVPGGKGYTRLSYNGAADGMDHYKITNSIDTVYRLMPANAMHGCVKQYSREHEFTQEFEALSSALTKLKEERSAAHKALSSALWSVTTIEKLLTVWPDAEAFVKPYLGSKSPSLPAVPVDKLNDMLRLPPEEVA